MSSPQELAPGASLEWLHEGKVVIFTLTSTEINSIDIFIERVILTLNAWSPDQPILVVYNLPKVALNPYFRRRAAEATRQTPDRAGRAAFVLGDYFIERLARLVLNRILNPKKLLIRRLFATYESALAWVTEGL